MIAMTDKIYTIQDIVKARGCSVRRANQLVTELKLGKVVGQTRVMDAEEFKLVVKLPDRRTKKFRNSQKNR
jgi:hypothetical protein